jgi:hypothetical protein
VRYHIASLVTGDSMGAESRQSGSSSSRPFDDGARDAVVADVGGLLDEHDRQVVLTAFFGKLAETDRGGQTGRAAAHDQDIDFEGIALWHNAARFPKCGKYLRARRRSQELCA